MHRQNFNAIGCFCRTRGLPKHAYFFGNKVAEKWVPAVLFNFREFWKNKNRQTFWTCISKTTHPKVPFSKIKWNLTFCFCPAILDPYWHSLLIVLPHPQNHNLYYHGGTIQAWIVFSWCQGSSMALEGKKICANVCKCVTNTFPAVARQLAEKIEYSANPGKYLT